MSRIRKLFLFVLSLSVFLQSQNHDWESIEKVALKLYEEKKFDLAVIEFKRANVLYPNNKNYIINQEKIADSYRRMGFFVESINEYKKVLEIDEKYWNSIFEISYTYQLINNFSESNSFIIKSLDYYEESKYDSLIYLKATNHFGLMEIDSAIFYFSKVKDKIIYEKSMNSIEIIEEFQLLQLSSPKLAKYLNFLFPGLGYLYLGMPQTSVATFVVESLFLYSTVITYRNNYIIGSLFGGLFFSGFYLGSIYGAEQFAHRKNKELHRNYFEKLRLNQ